MSSEPTNLPDGDLRQHQRTSLFVMATLYTTSGSTPVKIRDLSPVGALIEGGAIPIPGTSVRLGRGSLNIIGEMVWSKAGRGGVRLESQVSLADWLPGRRLSDQQRVDALVQQAKAGRMLHSPSDGDISMCESGRLSAAELRQLGDAIDSLADDLTADPNVVRRHLAKLQVLDKAAQTIRKLASGR